MSSEQLPLLLIRKQAFAWMQTCLSIFSKIDDVGLVKDVIDEVEPKNTTTKSKR